MARAGELRIREGDALVQLADVQLRLGQREQAIAAVREGLEIHGETGYRLGEARALHILAKATGSEAYRVQATALFAELGAPEPD